MLPTMLGALLHLTWLCYSVQCWSHGISHLSRWRVTSHLFSIFSLLAAQCLLLLACMLVLAAPGHSLNTFKKSPSNTSTSALKKTST